MKWTWLSHNLEIDRYNKRDFQHHKSKVEREKYYFAFYPFYEKLLKIENPSTLMAYQIKKAKTVYCCAGIHVEWLVFVCSRMI